MKEIMRNSFPTMQYAVFPIMNYKSLSSMPA